MKRTAAESAMSVIPDGDFFRHREDAEVDLVIIPTNSLTDEISYVAGDEDGCRSGSAFGSGRRLSHDLLEHQVLRDINERYHPRTR